MVLSLLYLLEYEVVEKRCQGTQIVEIKKITLVVLPKPEQALISKSSTDENGCKMSRVNLAALQEIH